MKIITFIFVWYCLICKMLEFSEFANHKLDFAKSFKNQQNCKFSLLNNNKSSSEFADSLILVC